MVTPGSVRMVLERLAADGTVVARSNGSTHQVYPIAVSMAEGQALRAWIVRERVSKTIEIGLGYAVSTLHICDGLLEVGGHDPRHLAIDPYQHSRFGNCGPQLLEDAGVRDLEILLPDLLRRGMSFDFAFIDGNHRFDGVFVDLFYLGRLVQLAGSSSSMITSFPAFGARSRFTSPILDGCWPRHPSRISNISGQCSAPP